MNAQLLRVKDVARSLSLSEWEVRRLCKAGELEMRYIGTSNRFYRVTSTSVDAYIESLGGAA